MFAWHETTRRTVGRAAFLLLALLPTCATFSWLIYQATPIHARRERLRWEERLSQRMDLRVTIGRAVRTRYDAVQLQNVRLSDPESNAEIAAARLVDAAPSDHGWVVLISQAEVQAEHGQRLSEILSNRLLRDVSFPNQRWEVVLPTLSLRDGETSQTLNDLQLVAEGTERQAQATLDFRVAGIDMREPAQYRVTRDRKSATAKLGWELRTQSAAIPTSLLAPFWPALRRLGDDSRFTGLMKFADSPDGWQGEVDGVWRRVDFSRLVREQLSQGKLSGQAEIVVKQMRVERGRVTAAAGEIKSHSGVIGRPLLEAIARPDTLRLQLSDTVRDSADNHWTYRDLALGFRISERGLELSGNVAHSAGTIMADARGGLVFESGQGPVPAVALVRALVPDDELQIPATRETATLLNLLPIPSAEAHSTTIARPPVSPPLRLNPIR